jgi:hypothetical protein
MPEHMKINIGAAARGHSEYSWCTGTMSVSMSIGVYIHMYFFIERDCPARFIWLEVVSFKRSPLKGEAPRFLANFNHHLSCKEAMKVSAPPCTGLGN